MCVKEVERERERKRERDEGKERQRRRIREDEDGVRVIFGPAQLAAYSRVTFTTLHRIYVHLSVHWHVGHPKRFVARKADTVT